MRRSPARPTLFPYTTLFRSGTMSGSGVTNINSGATLNLTNNGVNTFLTRTLNNAGTTIYTGTSGGDRKSTRLNSSHVATSYAVYCLKKKNRVLNAGTNLFTN